MVRLKRSQAEGHSTHLPPQHSPRSQVLTQVLSRHSWQVASQTLAQTAVSRAAPARAQALGKPTEHRLKKGRPFDGDVRNLPQTPPLKRERPELDAGTAVPKHHAPRRIAPGHEHHPGG